MVTGTTLDFDETGVDLDAIALMHTVEAATWCDAVLRQIDRTEKQSFALKGLILYEVERRELWKYLIDPERSDPTAFNQYQSFDSWVKNAAPWSNGSCRSALNAVKELKDIPPDVLMSIPRCNLLTMKSLSTAARTDPAIQAAAINLPEREFIAQLSGKYPEQHIEQPAFLRFRASETQRQVVEGALACFMRLNGDMSREAALEGIAVDYLLDNEQKETA